MERESKRKVHPKFRRDVLLGRELLMCDIVAHGDRMSCVCERTTGRTRHMVVAIFKNDVK